MPLDLLDQSLEKFLKLFKNTGSLEAEKFAGELENHLKIKKIEVLWYMN